jgi:hypothetical protein
MCGASGDGGTVVTTKPAITYLDHVGRYRQWWLDGIPCDAIYAFDHSLDGERLGDEPLGGIALLHLRDANDEHSPVDGETRQCLGNLFVSCLFLDFNVMRLRQCSASDALHDVCLAGGLPHLCHSAPFDCLG